MPGEDIKREINRITGDKPVNRMGEKKISGLVDNKSVGRKFVELFIASDFKTVKESVIRDTIVPTIKGLIVDTLINGIQGIFGTGTGYKSTGSKLVRSNASYQGYYDNKSSQAPIERKENRYFYENIVMTERAAAKELLDTLNATIMKYSNVSVGELYDKIDYGGGEFTDNYIGWKDFIPERITRTHDGWWLQLPKPVSLK